MAADQLTDKEDQFKRRARRRLVGAIALVLLMVTVLPMVLDDRSNQSPAQPEIAISIPSQEGADFTSKIVPVTPQQATTSVAPVEKSTEVPQAANSHKADPSGPVADKMPGEKVATNATTAVKEPPATNKSSEPPADSAASKAETAKPVPAEAKAKLTPQAIRKGSLSVQIGVFSDAAKVKQMLTKISETGTTCYTENMDTPKGVKIRVRCGPFADKTAAQQALENLKASGFKGILVTNQ